MQAPCSQREVCQFVWLPLIGRLFGFPFEDADKYATERGKHYSWNPSRITQSINLSRWSTSRRMKYYLQPKVMVSNNYSKFSVWKMFKKYSLENEMEATINHPSWIVATIENNNFCKICNLLASPEIVVLFQIIQACVLDTRRKQTTGSITKFLLEWQKFANMDGVGLDGALFVSAEKVGRCEIFANYTKKLHKYCTCNSINDI